MIFKTGDNVRFLNEVGGGIIVRIIDNKHVEIKDDNDFIIPVLISELVLIPSDLKSGKKEKNEEKQPYVKDNSYNYAERDQWDYLDDKKHTETEKKEEKVVQKNDNKILLAFVPENADSVTSSNLNLFIINDTDFHILFNLNIENSDGLISLEHGDVEPNHKIYISIFQREDLNNVNALSFQAICFKKIYFKQKKTIDFQIKIKNTKFYKENTFSENDYFDQPAYLISVTDAQYNDILEKKASAKMMSSEEIREKIKTDIVQDEKNELIEVDLHVNKIIDNYLGMSNGEILNTQINYFRKKLENAILNKAKRIVFIHGIGNGTLKNEVRRILKEEYVDYSFQDASHKEYGFGATMVNL
ncbi:MAG: DUF2027 domain-containing protein [Bacteroidota bacterium]